MRALAKRRIRWLSKGTEISYTDLYSEVEPHGFLLVLSIRNLEADRLARQLAAIEETPLTHAVIIALKEALASRRKRETAAEAAQRLLKKHGVALTKQGSKPVPQATWDELADDSLAYDPGHTDVR
jgi:antitoxin VapB